MWKRIFGVSVVVIAVVLATALWALERSSDSGVLSAFAQACDATRTADYDVAVTTRAPEGITQSTVRVSGDDAHATGTMVSPEGTRIGSYEWIVKDRVWYYREYKSDVPPSGTWTIEEGVSNNIRNVSCASNDEGERYSSGDGESSPDYTRTYSLSKELTIMDELWVGDDGFPERTRSTRTKTTMDGSALQLKEEFVYSGFGELNLIEAPVAE